MTHPDRPLINTHQLAELLGVSRSTILHNRKDHPLYSKAIKVGGKTHLLQWHPSDVDAYLEAQRTGVRS